MLNVFPIQFLAPIAYMVLRLCVGFVFLYLGHRHLKNRRTLMGAFEHVSFAYGSFFVWYMGFFEMLIGVLFILGLYTQIAALLSMILIAKLFFLRKRLVHPLLPGPLARVLLFFASMSLFITGAGIFAFDLPI